VRRTLRRSRARTAPDGTVTPSVLVEGEPKTTGSRARLVLPTVLVDALRAHRAAQAAARLRAPHWGDPGLVFTTPVGTWLEPRNVGRDFELMCARAGIRRYRVHDLRHTAGSLLLLEGASMKVVQETLRHSRMATTADVYAHVLDELRDDAADRMDGFVRRVSRS
jgi:integrase